MNIKDLFGSFAPQIGQQQAAENPLFNRREAGWNAAGGALQGLGIGLMTGDWGRAMEVNNSAVDDYRKRKVQNYTAQQLMEEAAARKAERDKQASEEAQREEFLKSLPPDVQMKARSIPGFLEDYVKATDPTFQTPEKPSYMEVNNKIINPATGQVIYDGGGGSSGEAPVVKTIYDPETGQEQVVQWTGQGWQPLGGPKAKGDARSSATELKQLWSSQDEIPALDSTIDSLQTALSLNEKTFTGATAGIRGWAGTAVPGASMVLDQDAAKATREFGQIMSMEAIKSMSETLKGATTDRELSQFVEILADPSTPPEIRKRTIQRMLSLAEKVRQIKLQRVNELKGSTKGPVDPVVTVDGYTIEPVE